MQKLYRCGKCGETREYTLSLNQARPYECENPNCGAEGINLARQYHGQTFGISSGSNVPEPSHSKPCPLEAAVAKANPIVAIQSVPSGTLVRIFIKG